MAELIRVLIVDDETLVRAGSRALIEAEPGMTVVGEAAEGEAAVDLARQTLPDVADDPDLAHVRVLILTTFDHDEYVVEALGAGASGFIIKNTDPRQLLRGIRVVADGDSCRRV